MNPISTPVYKFLEDLNPGLDRFEVSLGIAGYFRTTAIYSAEIRAIYGLMQIVMSLAISIICGIGMLINLIRGQKISSNRWFFTSIISFPYFQHGVENCVRSLFESDPYGGPILIMYDLVVGRQSYDNFFNDVAHAWSYY